MLNIGERRRLPYKTSLERFKRFSGAFNLNEYAPTIIANMSGQRVPLGERKDERAKANSLHNTGD